MKKHIRRLSFLALGFGALVLIAGRARAQCNLYPIAVSVNTLATAAVGDILPDIFNGTQPGNFGWLSWTGKPNEPTLVNSLTAPGDSADYINPLAPSDHEIKTGKWISGKPGVSNSAGVRNALNTLENIVITVPVWDVSTGSGSNARYHVVGYANVQIISYQLPSQNRITVKFLGYATCDSGNGT